MNIPSLGPRLASGLVLLGGVGLALPAQAETSEFELSEITVVSTAEEELRQAPGVSIITEGDLKRTPPANDLSEIIRKMPGVNLTGNTSSGQYGNSRQIDIRGMGPENTLILIDGKPVRSRNSIRMGSQGERNTRGDSNWVPVDAIEKIEVLRGPAAARYGNGAAGGVVNIITKKPGDTASGSVSVYGLMPEDGDEGWTARTTFNLMTPLTDTLSMRFYGNLAKTKQDSLNLNPRNEDGNQIPGREGVTNRDLNALLRWEPIDDQIFELDLGYSRQGNLYAGEQPVSSTLNPDTTLTKIGSETNVLYRTSLAASHMGKFEHFDTRFLFQYEQTNNKRLKEGMTGGIEGTFSGDEATTNRLRNYGVQTEISAPFDIVVPQRATMGFEFNRETLNDPYAATALQSFQNSTFPGFLDYSGDPARNAATIFSVFFEDNIQAMPQWTVTPGVRLDHHSDFGVNVSPSVHTSYELFDGFSLKGGVARAYKAPNLYQSNPGYLYTTRGNGCPVAIATGSCLILGNGDLKPETSWNKEIGFGYDKNGWAGSLTYFHNQYKNKITASQSPIASGTSPSGTEYWLMQWENATRATIQGIEGNILVPLPYDVSWNTNLTYMIENKDQDGQPLSLIPKYTVNSLVDWAATEDLALTLGVTWYGAQHPRDKARTRSQNASGFSTRGLKPYALMDLGGTYQLFDNTSVLFGIKNVLDKRVYRSGNNSNSGGASVYNELGRAYYLSTVITF